MKVYACPKECPVPVIDYRNYDSAKVLASEEQHKIALKAWLIAQGYKGPHTGKIVSSQIADGHAVYMLADGPKSFLIHLPYGDGYQDRDIQFVPKKEILRRCGQEDRLAAMFAEARARQSAANPG